MERNNDQNKIEKLLEEKKKKLAVNNRKMVEMNEQNAKLEKEISGMEEQMAKMVKVKQIEKQGQKRKLIVDTAEVGSNSGKRWRKLIPKTSIRRRPLPAELMNELFDSLPFENAFGLLIKMSNGLLARNVQKTIKSIKMAMKNNKLNREDCGPMMVISGEELIVTHTGPNGCKTVRAIMPIPLFNLAAKTPSIAFYFEVHILNTIRKSRNYWRGPPIYYDDEYTSYAICFSGERFPLKSKWPGNVNSIGFGHNRRGGGLWIDGNRAVNSHANFREGNVFGIGLIHFAQNSLKCFATCNGQLLGVSSELPPKFATLKLFPTISLGWANQSMRANFGKEQWRFKDFKHALEYTTRKSSRLN